MTTREEKKLLDLWRAYDDWLAEHWPEGADMLQDPAADAQVSALEEALQVKLPDDFIACLKIHNGQDDSGPILGGWDFLSTGEIHEQWKIWIELLDAGEFDGISSEPQAGIRNDWFNRKWIPFTHDGAGNHLCIDLDPAASGTHGQVITMWHDGAEREHIAGSFLEFFQAYVKGVLSGRYVYSEDYGGIVDADDA